MAAVETTPMDTIVPRFPLPIAPPENKLPSENSDIANWHHAFHPASAPELQSLGGQALRHSRTQLVAVEMHNQGLGTYHNIYHGPELPDADDEHQQFMLSVLASAGYIPRKGIDFLGTEPLVRDLTGAERGRLRQLATPQRVSPKQVVRFVEKHPEIESDDAEARLKLNNKKNAMFTLKHFHHAYEPLRAFLVHYTFKHGLVHVLDDRKIEQFLGTEDDQRKRELGHWLLVKAAELTIDPELRQTYKALKAANLLRSTTPGSPQTIIKFAYGTTERREELFPDLHQELLKLRAAV